LWRFDSQQVAPTSGLDQLAEQDVGIVGGVEFPWNDANPPRNVSNTSETPVLIDARDGYSYRGNESTPTRDVYVLDGNNMLVSRHLVEVLGGFDDDCFMYYEDADLCARALALGYRIRFCAEMQVWYRRDLSSDCIPYRQQYLAQRNHFVFVARHFPAASGPTPTSLACTPAEARSSRAFERGGPLAG